MKTRLKQAESILKELVAPYNIAECNHCEGTGKEPNTLGDACHICGGYGEHPSGDIMEVIISAREYFKGANHETRKTNFQKRADPGLQSF